MNTSTPDFTVDFLSRAKLEEVLSTLQSTMNGLSENEAGERVLKYGKNIVFSHTHSALHIILKQLNSSLVLLLFIAGLFSLILKDWTDGVIIFCILVINSLLGFTVEYRSQKVIEKLSKSISRSVLVIREGLEKTIPSDELTIGDIIVLKQGDIVPADCRICSANDLFLNESQLTGESVQVEKSASPSSVANNHSDIIYTGSIVEKGETKALVYAIARSTELGKIAILSTETVRETQYEKSLRSFSTWLLVLILISLAITLLLKVYLVHGTENILSIFLFISALAIAVVPEALPAIVTVTLSLSASKLAKRHVVVKRLSAIEDLGNVTLLCTDKTGTLTQNIMSVERVFSEDETLFLEMAIATLENPDEKRKHLTSSFDSAFLAFTSKEIQSSASRFVKCLELPFDPNLRRRRVIIEDKQTKDHFLVVIGAVEVLLQFSSSKNKTSYLKQIDSDEKQGLRHLGYAYKKIVFSKEFNISRHEKDLSFLGFASLSDPLRPTTLKTIQLAQQKHIDIKILTGDSPQISRHIAEAVGLIKKDELILTGEEIELLSPKEMRVAVENHSVFARVNPSQKFRIIQALKQKHVVAYQGDGINDAPALKIADVAIAVNTASDVAKENADIVLLNSSLETIINGVMYGRACFLNIDKYIKYTMIGNFGNFFALIALYLFSFNLPILPIQILLTSLSTDLPLITISTDTVEHMQLRRPERFTISSLLSISLILGGVTTIFELFFFTLVRIHPIAYTQTSLFLFLSLIQLIVIFSVRSKDHFWRSKKPSLLLTGSIIATAFLSLLFVYVGVFAHFFSFTRLPIPTLLFILGMVALYMLTLDIVKVVYYRRVGRLQT